MLDDATSALDTLTAGEVERALAHEVRPGTRLVVAHRLSAAARADLVVWLDAGRVRATGTHAALWHDPDYRAVFAAAGTPAAAPGRPSAPPAPPADPAGEPAGVEAVR